MDVVIISPEPGKTVEIGKRLLELADSPRDVQWVTWPAPGGFSVPLGLFLKFDTEGDDYVTVGLDEEKFASATEGAKSVTLEETPKRRRRRSKESTDNNTSEEE